MEQYVSTFTFFTVCREYVSVGHVLSLECYGKMLRPPVRDLVSPEPEPDETTLVGVGQEGKGQSLHSFIANVVTTKLEGGVCVCVCVCVC